MMLFGPNLVRFGSGQSFGGGWFLWCNIKFSGLMSMCNRHDHFTSRNKLSQ